MGRGFTAALVGTAFFLRDLVLLLDLAWGLDLGLGGLDLGWGLQGGSFGCEALDKNCWRKRK